jgi:ligand-binding sensor domain-containing protein/signal transduction histidine kinase
VTFFVKKRIALSSNQNVLATFMKKKLKQIPFRTIFAIFAIFVSSIISSFAQDNDIRFNHYTIEDGLSQNSVFAILQDHHGFMWFGTRTGGLNRFNGSSFTTYKKSANDSLSISSNEILALCEDKNGMIWIGTRNGSVSRYDENYNHFFNYIEKKDDNTSISSKTVSCFLEDTQGKLWLGTNYGLCEYNREKDNFIRHEGKGDFKSTNIKSIVQAGENLLWLGGIRGVYLYNTQTKEVLKHYKHEEENPTSLSETHIMALAIDANGKLWVGSYNKGLNRLDDPEKGVFTHFKNDRKNKNSLSNDIIRTLHFDRNNTLWVGTRTALEKLLPSQQNSKNPIFIHYQKEENNPYGINQNSIYSFYEANDNNIWFGSYLGGVNQFYKGPKKFNKITSYVLSTNKISDDVVNSFAETAEGTWVGTEGGLYLFKPKTKESKVFTINTDESNIFDSNYVKALYVDHSDDLWVGTFKGLFLYDKKLGRFKVCIEEKYIYSITEGIPGEIWVGTLHGLFKIDKSTCKIVACSERNEKGISATNIQKVYRDSKGRIWITSKSGLYKYNRKNDRYDSFFHSNTDVHSLSHSYCTSINEDAEGNIWIGTLDGLNRLDEKNMQFEHLGEAEGLPDNVINNILFDDTGNLWITTNKGLSKIEKSVFSTKIVNDSIHTKEIRNFNIEDGLVNTEFRQNASFKNKTGELFFGGSGGFNFFYPDSIKDNPHVPKVAITKLKLFNKEVLPGSKHAPISKPIWLTESITLNHKQSVIAFEFAAFNYTSPLKNQYAYMLEGYDKEWNYIGNKHEASYTSLPAGNYIFRVKASNNDGLWNTQGVSLEIKVTPPFWETWWFRSMIVILIFTSIALYYSKQIKDEKKLNRLLETKVSERTSELRKNNKLLSQKSEKIKEQHDQLLEANLVKDKLFSVIAHDLRNPFNAIMGFSEMLVTEFHNINDNDKLSYAKDIYSSSSTLFDLLDSLLLWSRSQRGTIKPNYQSQNIIKLLENNIKIAELQAKDKNIQIKKSFQSDEFQVVMDANLINTVIRNLLSNAIKFTHFDGEIALLCAKEKDRIIVRIKDNGIGISSEAQANIFHDNTEYISEGTNQEKGTGLGLLICQDFINLHQGNIWMKSEVGKGSEFCFSLPLTSEK